MPYGITELWHYWFMWRLISLVPSHYLSKCWSVFNWSDIWIQIQIILIRENYSEIVIGLAAILSWPQCIKFYVLHLMKWLNKIKLCMQNSSHEIFYEHTEIYKYLGQSQQKIQHNDFLKSWKCHSFPQTTQIFINIFMTEAFIFSF